MTTWNNPPVHGDYGTLWQSIKSRANGPGSIDENQARIVHVRWRRLGKLAAAGRLK